MSFNIEIGPEETMVFLEESEELLQLLDENIIKLENDNENPKTIQEIFRAVHTLKGISSMQGHKRMADVTHAMETLMDKVRSRKLEIDELVINALLTGIDAIKSLIQEVVTMRECQIDVVTIVNQLVMASEEMDQGLENTTNGIAAQGTPTTIGLSLDEESKQKIDDAMASGLKVYQIRVHIAPTGNGRADGNIQALVTLGTRGIVVASQPTRRQTEGEKVEKEMLVIFCTNQPANEIQEQLRTIANVTGVQIIEYKHSIALTKTGNDVNVWSKERCQASVSEQGLDPRSAANQQGKLDGLQSVRVDVKLLDGLMNMVEELVFNRSKICQVGKIIEDRYPYDEMIRDLVSTSNRQLKIFNELHQSIIKIKLVPISLVFNKLSRLARDLAQKQNKILDLSLYGGEIELDRVIIEQISDPLIHLLRNAVDHGIESPEARRVARKPSRAKVNLAAFQEHGHIFITIEDDGAGIDSKQIKKVAVRNGAITQKEADKLTRKEAINLIFVPGISTASKITEISGRGVGMDIVRTNIERLNGTIAVDTELGKGTIFTIKMPLTLSVFQGLLVSIRREVYIIPLMSVVETLGIEADLINTVISDGVIRLRGELIPLLRLDSILGLSEYSVSNGKCYVIVVRVNNRLFGIIVDDLMENQRFIIKPIVMDIGDIKGIAGTTIIGDGKVALILDVPVIIEMAEKSGNMEIR